MSCTIGIDFGGTSVKSGVVLEGAIVHRGNPILTQEIAGVDAMIDALVCLIAQLGEFDSDIAAIGLGLPGLIDSDAGIVHEMTNVPGWERTPLRDILSTRLGLPVTLENDAKAMAYGEWQYGAARRGRYIICVTLGTGVGGALILDGKLHRGAQLGAGEIGQLSIDYRGRPGPYGNLGSLEEYIGNEQITTRAMAAYRLAGRPVAPSECSPQKLAAAALRRDAVALQLWEEVGTELGAALASLVWVINPDTIVIGGGVAQAGELLFAPVRRAIQSRTQKLIHERLRVVPAMLGNDAGIIGSASLAMDSVRAEPSAPAQTCSIADNL